MAINIIRKKSELNRPLVQSGQYTLALLWDACRAGIIDEESVNCTHRDILNLLKDLIMKYTKGESSSVQAETAQRLLESILYAIDARTILFADPAEAVVIIIKHGVNAIYNQGFQLVTASTESSRALYLNLKAHKLGVGTHAYNLTIEGGLAGFFADYDPRFQAQDTVASIDYPLLFDDMSITGIFYIEQYLKKLAMENCFCQLFSTASAAKLLERYGQVYAIDYRETLLNLFEVLLTNAIFAVLAGSKPLELNISPTQFDLLRQRLIDSPLEDCSRLIKAALEALIAAIPRPPIGLSDYMRNFMPILIPGFWSGLQNDTLPNVMIVDLPPIRRTDIIFDRGVRLDDDGFRTLVEQVIDTNSPAGKAVLISASVHSIEDFIDLLEADCLFDDEFEVLYETLGDLELSILARIVFLEDLRLAGTDFFLPNTFIKSLDIEWQTAYIQFLQSLNLERLDSIQNLIHSF